MVEVSIKSWTNPQTNQAKPKGRKQKTKCDGSPWLSTWHLGMVKPSLRSCYHQIGLWACIGGILIIDNWWRIPSIVGSPIPRLLCLGYITNEVEQASKQHASLHGFRLGSCLQAPSLSFCLVVLCWWTVIYKLIKPSPPQDVLSQQQKANYSTGKFQIKEYRSNCGNSVFQEKRLLKVNMVAIII